MPAATAERLGMQG